MIPARPSRADNPTTRAQEIEELEKRLSGTAKKAGERRRKVLSARYRLWLVVKTSAKRGFDILSASLLLTVLSPLLVILLLLSQGRLDKEPRLGRWAEPFNLLAFRLAAGGLSGLFRSLRFHNLAVLVNILRGDLSWIGPRPLRMEEASAAERLQWRRWTLYPGVLSLWWIRKRANINFDSEWATDVEYERQQSFWGDAGVAARALPALLYGGAPDASEDSISVLGLRMDNITMSDTLRWIGDRAREAVPRQICFVNADCANRAWTNRAYRNVLNSSTMTLADGIGVKLAGRLLGRPVRQNVNGTDLFPRLCALLAEESRSVFLLGAKPGVADAVAEWIQRNAPTCRVAGFRNGYFRPEEEGAVVDSIAQSGADVLLVAFGAPRQDLWIAEHLPRLGVKVAIGVGGLFDFYSGRIARAPQWMRDTGLEWLFRFMQEPGRMWRRYFVGNAQFLFRVTLERLGSRPWEKESTKCAR